MRTANGLRILLIKPKARLRTILGLQAYQFLEPLELGYLAAAVPAAEFWRGAKARHRKSGQNLALGLWRLGGRNRRRYGGYVIHLGVVLMAIGVIGIELFQTETQGTIPQGVIDLTGGVFAYLPIVSDFRYRGW